MSVHTKADWKPWLEERRHFKNRESEGLTKDMEALAAHIKRLQELAPKDTAGWPIGNALKTIDTLHLEYLRIQRLIEQLR